jgi:hypothetical protein
MLRKVLPAVLAIGFVVALGSAAPIKPDPAKPAADPDLAGKFVIVVTKGEKNHSMVLENVRVKRLGTREFLLGEYVDETGERPFEATYWLPLEEVEYLMEFKSLDAIKKMDEARRKAPPLRIEEGKNSLP